MKVSIVIPVYNEADSIGEMYNLLINQSGYHWEALFLDDGSRDESLVALKKISDKDQRIKVIEIRNNFVNNFKNLY